MIARVAVSLVVGVFAQIDQAVIDKECGVAYSAKKNERTAQLSMQNMTKKSEINAMCGNIVTETQCEAAVKCTWCNTKCHPVMDETSECHKTRVQILMYGPSKAVAAVGGGIDKLKTAYNKCSSNTDQASCIAGSGMCNWCETTTSCHVHGSPQDKCLTDYYKNYALNNMQKAKTALTSAQTTAKAKFDQAQTAAKSKFQDQVSLCNKTANKAGCGEEMRCMWCTTAYSAPVEQCYFIGDTSNPCIAQNLGKITDAAGKVQDGAKWAATKAGEKFTDMKNWGNDICGKHTSNATACGDAKTCSWCTKDTNCYIYASINNPCGVGGFLTSAKSGVSNAWSSAKSWWSGDKKGDACATDLVETKKTLQAAFDASKKNLEIFCREVGSSQAFVEKTLMAMSENVSADTNAATATVNAMEVRKLLLAVNGTSQAIDNKNSTKMALDQFTKDNPGCVAAGNKSSDAVQATSAVLILSATTFLW